MNERLFWSGAILVGGTGLVCAILLSVSPREPKVVTIGPANPINWTEAGEGSGKRAGRMVRGFFRGLWRSGDGK